LITLLGWRWLGPIVQPIFFWPVMLIGLGLFMAIMLVLLSLLMRRREIEAPPTSL
jgi:hypothetical protein